MLCEGGYCKKRKDYSEKFRHASIVYTQRPGYAELVDKFDDLCVKNCMVVHVRSPDGERATGAYKHRRSRPGKEQWEEKALDYPTHQWLQEYSYKFI